MKNRFHKLVFGIGIAIITLRICFLNTVPTVYNQQSVSDVVVSKNEALPPVTSQPESEVCTENSSIKNFPNFTDQPQPMKDFLTYRHCKSFPLLLDSPMKCGGSHSSKEVFLLLAIKSSPANYERREAIRKTWGVENTYSGVNVKRIFLCGIPKKDKESNRMMQLLQIESRIYGDIVQWDFIDSFYNLTLKQVLFHQWFNDNCPEAQFVFNGDDDVFLNTLNVITYLRGLGENIVDQPLFVGQLNIGMPPVREKYSKYYVPAELFPGDSFLPYCGGGGIIMSGFTARSIFKASRHIPLFPIDDAYLGMCLDKAGLKPDNHEGIRTLGIRFAPSIDSFNPCFYREMLMVHRFVPYEMLVMWKALQVTHLNCRSKRATAPMMP